MDRNPISFFTRPEFADFKTRQFIVFNARYPSKHDWYFSNFARCNVDYEGITFSTVEHAFQAAKYPDACTRRRIAAMSDARAAKKLGRAAPLAHDWDTRKYDIMYDLLVQKFHQNPYNLVLLESGDAMLIEDAGVWDDDIWGIGRDRVGANMLGVLLMEVRTKLASE